MNTDIVIRKRIIENIQGLINKGKIEEAKDILNHYDQSVIDAEVEIYSIKGIIYMMERDFKAAEEVFKLGLNIDSKDFNLNYNLGYLYQFKENNELAIKYYKIAINNTKKEEEINQVYEILKELGLNKDKEEILKKDNQTLGGRGINNIQKVESYKGYLRNKYKL